MDDVDYYIAINNYRWLSNKSKQINKISKLQKYRVYEKVFDEILFKG